MKNMLSNLFENIFPFIAYILNKRNITQKIQTPDSYHLLVEKYSTLEEEKLTKRISEEHDPPVSG